MAIQFDCPYCTATIRVSDQAAGKKGTCPQCQTKIIVPTPKGLPAESPPDPGVAAPTFPPPVAPPPMPFVSLPPPGFAPPGYAPPPMIPAPTFYPPADVPAADVHSDDDSLAKARATRRKREARKRKVIWSGIALVVVMAGAVGGFLFANKNKPNPLSGELTATLLTDGKLEPVKIFRDEIKIDSELLETALKQLEKRPVKLVSERMRMQIRGGADGLQVSLSVGQADLIAVPVGQNKNLANWSKREGGKLADRHRQELAQTAKEFVQAWIEADARGDKKPDFGRFHDELGLTSLAMGLGSEAVAIINGVEHRCIAEQSGSLYFLLPPGARRFELHGHEDSKGQAVFTGRFKVRVTEEDSPKKKKAEALEEGDDKPSESTKDAFGRPAANDPAAVRTDRQ